MNRCATPRPVVGHAHLAGVFAPVAGELDAPALEVIGNLPAALNGAYVRNGPNPRFWPIGSYTYPFDGDGMVHRVTIRDGNARYTNRFVRTPAVRTEEAAGNALWAGVVSPYRPAADVVGPVLAGTDRELPAVNVVCHAGKLLALAESGRPYRLDGDLRTVGPESFGGSQPRGITAHPKIDPRTGEMVVFCCHRRPPYLTWSVIRPDGRGTRPVPVAGVGRPTVIHDMALTEHFALLVLAPLFFDRAALTWEPEAGTRIALIPRDGGIVRWGEDTAFWLWHTVGAYELDDPVAGNPIVLHYVEWERPHGLVSPGARGTLTRALIDPACGTVRRTSLTDDPVEFPRIDDRLVTRRYRFVAAAGSCDHGDSPFAHNALRWFDLDAGTSTVWCARNLVVGEPAYAPDPGNTAPDSGWWLTIATHRATGESWLLVFPAADPAAGPQARIRMPARVPLGLHGNWLPAQQ